MYEYKVIKTEEGPLVIRRIAIYLSILLIVISSAMLILFLLFEKYLQILFCVGAYGVAITVLCLIKGKKSVFSYSFRGETLYVENPDGKVFELPMGGLSFLKYSDDSDELNEEISKYCFADNEISMTNLGGRTSFEKCIFLFEDKKVLLLMDDYAFTLFQRGKK